MKQTLKPVAVEGIFYDIIENIPKLIEHWANTNHAVRELPYHYDILYLKTPLTKNHTVTIELKRTVTGGKASYDNASAIMNAFKRAHVIITIDGTMKAYDLHLRYDRNESAYKPLKMDVKRLRELDAKYGAMNELVKTHKSSVSKHITPETCQTAYPRVLKFYMN